MVTCQYRRRSPGNFYLNSLAKINLFLRENFETIVLVSNQISRGGQSVTVIDSQLYMFGGEDKKRRLLNDLHILDLETMTWEVAQTM
jgi:Kelch motif